MKAMIRPRIVRAAGLALWSPLFLAGPALADHPGATRPPEMSPLTLALISGGLALAVVLLVVVIVMLLTRRPSSPEQAPE